MATLFPIGDRELWFAKAADDSWALPLYLDWKLDRETNIEYALVMPAVGLYVNQHLLLKALLGSHDVQGRDDNWVISKKMVAALLHKAPGITPMAYYRWPDPNQPVLPLSSPLHISPKGPKVRSESGSSDYEAFVSHVSQLNGLPSSAVRAVFRAVMDAAPKWMLEERRPLDLGFCRLIAVPFRANWKEIVAFKFKRWKLLGLFGLPQADRWTALDEAGLPEALCSPHNVGLRRGVIGKDTIRIEYQLEAIPSRKFESAVTAVEVARITCGTTSYVASWEKTVESLYRHLVDALETYLHKTALPFAKVSERGRAGLLRFLPTSGLTSKLRGVALRHLPVNIVASNSRFSVFGESGNPTAVRPKAPPVPPLPDIPQINGNLREPEEQRQLAESTDRESGTAGMPMLHAAEGEDEGQPVLSGATTTDGTTSGVDGERDWK